MTVVKQKMDSTLVRDFPAHYESVQCFLWSDGSTTFKNLTTGVEGVIVGATDEYWRGLDL